MTYRPPTPAELRIAALILGAKPPERPDTGNAAPETGFSENPVSGPRLSGPASAATQ